MSGPPAAAPSACRACGQCCRALSLEQSLATLTALAADEAARLRRRPDTPHRAEIERLVRDVAFIARHFHPLDRAAAVARQPAFAGAEFDGRHFFSCDALRADGRCAEHAARPYVCAGYPWYLGAPHPDRLVCRPCGYEAECPPPEARDG